METVDDGSSEYNDGQGFKAPNQLFEKLQKKLEMKATQIGHPGTTKPDHSQNRQLKEMISRIKNEIRMILKKLADERMQSEQPLAYRRYYSFAVRFLFARQQGGTAAGGHTSFSSQKFYNYASKNNQSFTNHMHHDGREDVYSEREDSMTEDPAMNGQDQSEFQAQEGGMDAYEDTERSNQRLQRERHQMIQENYVEQYKFIGDGAMRCDQEGNEQMEQESYVESTPDRENMAGCEVDQSYYNNNNENYQPENMPGSYSMVHGDEADDAPFSGVNQSNFGNPNLQRPEFTKMHGPSISVLSKFSLNKDAYTLEDYV